MINKAKKVSTLIFSLLVALIVLIQYIYNTYTTTSSQAKNKQLFTKIIGLPNLALGTNISYIRHNSLHNISSKYSIDGTLRQSALESFVYTSKKGNNAKR